MKKNEKTNNQKDHDNTEKLKLPIPISEFKKNDFDRMKSRSKLSISKASNIEIEKNDVNVKAVF